MSLLRAAHPAKPGACSRCGGITPVAALVCAQVRTSTGTFFNKGHDEVVTRVEKRVAQVTMIPVGECKGEALVALRQ